MTASNHAWKVATCMAASELVTQALVLCEQADFELAAILLRDASNCLAEDLDDLRTEPG